jgi:hypothetical protein
MTSKKSFDSFTAELIEEINMQQALRYFSNYNPLVPVYEWKGVNLEIPLNGEYDQHRIHDTMLSLKETVFSADLPYWTRSMNFSDCSSSPSESIQATIQQLSAFYQWASENGCIAAAVIIPENRLPEFSVVKAISDDPHNGVRVFYHEEQAEQWLKLQLRRYQAAKLH